MHKFVLLIVAVTLVYGVAESKKVLLVPCQVTSHFLEITSISAGLVENGHDVYVTVSRGFPKQDKILKPGIKPLYFDPIPGTENFDLIASLTFEESFYSLGFRASNAVLNDCTAMVEDKKLNEEIASIGFDLSIVSGFPLSYCSFILPHVHGIPHVMLFSAIHPWEAGVPSLPSVHPHIEGTSYYSDNMSFTQRLGNLAAHILMMNVPLPGRRDTTLLQKYAPEFKSWETLVSRSQLFIETRNFVLEKPSPSMPNLIQTPGITVSAPKPLPKDLEAIMAQADKGVILVSFGSLAGNFPEDITDKLIEALNQVEHTVIWKFSGKSLENMKKKVKKHVHLLTWLPQNDILGHPKTRVFLTHCGNNGQFEAVYQGVPMVGLPISAEQFHNAFRQMDRGYGLSIIPGGLPDFTVEELVVAIKEVASNPKYKANVQKASQIMKDSPMTPTETCTYWLEHIMKFGGDHLRSHGLDMPWYQFFMLDILVVILITLHVIKFVVSKLVMKLYRKCFGPKEKAKVA